MNNRKTRIAIISVVALLLVLLGVTYAYWLVTKTQTGQNVVSSACLDITLDNESAAINLTSQYPATDVEGMKLTPYTFTVTNNCNTSVEYQVVLESIGTEANAVSPSALKVALDTKYDLLSNKATVEPTISGAYRAHRLGYGSLTATGSEGSSVSHSVRIWIDENAPISEMNKTFQSKISVTIGQGIKNPYVEGTMAYDILANNNEATTLSAVWVNKEPAAETYNSVSKTANNWYGTEYTLDTETGKYQLSGTLVQATLTECRDGSKACGEYTLKNATQDYKTSTLYKITSFTNSTQADSGSTLYMTTQSITAKNDFSTPTADGEGGLYKTIDDLGESYYFRGDVTNNYVQFGSYADDYKVYTISNTDVCWNSSCVYLTLESCQNSADYDYDSYDSDGNEVSCVEVTKDAGKDMYWRIVRINGDGTIRLVYDGTTKAENGTAHSATIGNSTYNRENYLNVNYGDSDIKEVVDEWYNTHLKTNYGGYIADGIFCNDKEVTKAYYYDENGEDTTADNALFTDVYYVSSDRLGNKNAPSLTCTRKEDRYTTKMSLGNGELTHPVGLLTADEKFLAGETTASNQTYYLYSGDYFWTFTPYSSIGNDAEAHVWFVYGNGVVNTDGLGVGLGARPVINLRADVEFTGNGSFETPYFIKTN